MTTNAIGTDPLLLVIRGNSGSGKTTTAREVRRRYGRGAALIEQDYVRRVVLREHGGNRADAVAPAFITTMARTALDAGYHVVLEGILHTGQYGVPLRELIAGHRGPSACFYLDVSFDETVRRHQRREEPIPVTAETMREWVVDAHLTASQLVVIGVAQALVGLCSPSRRAWIRSSGSPASAR